MLKKHVFADIGKCRQYENNISKSLTMPVKIFCRTNKSAVSFFLFCNFLQVKITCLQYIIIQRKLNMVYLKKYIFP